MGEIPQRSLYESFRYPLRLLAGVLPVPSLPGRRNAASTHRPGRSPALATPIGSSHVELARGADLCPGKLGIGKELVQTPRDLGIAPGTDSLLKHSGDEPVSRLTARLCCAINLREELVRDCDRGLVQSHGYFCW